MLYGYGYSSQTMPPSFSGGRFYRAIETHYTCVCVRVRARASLPNAFTLSGTISFLFPSLYFVEKKTTKQKQNKSSMSRHLIFFFFFKGSEVKHPLLVLLRMMDVEAKDDLDSNLYHVSCTFVGIVANSSRYFSHVFLFSILFLFFLSVDTFTIFFFSCFEIKEKSFHLFFPLFD